jgi:urease accessory protein
MQIRKTIRVWPVVFLSPSMAFAHDGLHGLAGLMVGFAHPFSGLDHVLAMLALGLWAARREGRLAWMPLMVFPFAMAGAALLALSGFPLPFAEMLAALSIAALGVLIACSARLPGWAAGLLVACFAASHGWLHGAELPADVASARYIAGFVLAALCLHLAGWSLGKIIRARGVLSWTGAGLAASGLWLMVAA